MVLLVQRKYALHNVHCGVCHRWDNTAPRCTSKENSKPCLHCTFLQHHLRPALRRKRRHFMTMQGVTLLLYPWTSCAAGNGRFWNIHRTQPMRVHAIISLRQSERITAKDTELNRAVGRNINKDGRADGV